MTQLAGHHLKVLADHYNLTGDSNSLTVTDERLALEATTFGDAVKHYILGQRRAKLEHKGFMNAASAGAHEALSGVAIDGVVSVILGQNAAPTVGDPMYSLVTLQSQYQTLPEYAQIIPFTAQFSNRGEAGGWGRALAVPTTFASNTTGTVVDDGAASNDGGAAFLHVLEASGNPDYTLTVKGATNSAFTTGVVTLASFSFSGSIVVGSQRVATTSAIPRYVRWEATGGTQGTVELAINLVRF